MFISPCGMPCHCSPVSVPGTVMLQLEWDTSLTRWPRISQRCSIGDRSGDMGGQSRLVMTGLQSVPCYITGILAGR